MSENIDTEVLRPTPGRDDEAVENFLKRYANALSQGQSATIAQMWQAPALVVSDSGVVAVGAEVEVDRFFAAAKAQYDARGITSTRPEIMRIQWLTDRVVSVDVRWPQLDARGEELGAESSSYTLRRDEEGELKVRVAIIQDTTTH